MRTVVPTYGTSMDMPLLVSSAIEHAAACHGDTEIVTRNLDESLYRTTYAQTEVRCRRLARALEELDIQPGERVASLAWNTLHHFELFYGISGSGAVLHTVNPRLFDEQIVYIINHAEDCALCVDAATLPIAERLAGKLGSIRHWIYMGAPGEYPDSSLKLVNYEALLARSEPICEWPVFDERWAATICYTSGTTGNPKGVAYSNRAAILSSMCISLADMIGGYQPGMLETVMPIAAMFHGNAWQMPYTAPMNGHKLVLPGRAFQAEKLHSLIVDEGVTISAAVPTIWMMLLDYVRQNGLDFGKLRAVLVSGSKPPESMIEGLEREYGVRVALAWGMTEALGATKTTPSPGSGDTLGDATARRQSRTNFLVRMRVVDDAGKVLPADGETVGNFQARGPFVTGSYFRQTDPPPSDWLDTGDLVKLHKDGRVELVDRSKDVIKSGGEWISSLQLEDAALGHPAVQMAAAIGIPHPKWQERPALLIVLRPGFEFDEAGLRAHLKSRIASWWMPDEIRVVEEIPLTGTGKVDKKVLRRNFV